MHKVEVKQPAGSRRQNPDRTSIPRRIREKYKASQEGNQFPVQAQMRGAVKYGSVIQRCPIPVHFICGSSLDVVEFERQLRAQEYGMNQLTYQEFITNRDNYIRNGRSPMGSDAQQAARENARLERVAALRREGKSLEEAEEETEEWLSTQAALHNPDQIAGGNPTNIGGLGDRRVNSSLGSQWRGNIDDVDRQIRQKAAGMTEEERRTKHIHVKFTYEVRE